LPRLSSRKRKIISTSKIQLNCPGFQAGKEKSSLQARSNLIAPAFKPEKKNHPDKQDQI